MTAIIRGGTDLHDEFSRRLSAFVEREGLSVEGLAWLCDCRKATAGHWLTGRNFPSRDNAVKLAFFDQALASFFERLAGVPAAKRRWGARHRRAA
jgi:hypothetical protein